MKSPFIFFVFFFFFFLTCCSNDKITGPETADYISDFDSVWTNFSEIYPLFDYKNINWTSVYGKYRNRFVSITFEERNNVFAEIFGVFKDAHIYFILPSGEQFGQYKPDNFTANFNSVFIKGFLDSTEFHTVNNYWGWSFLNNTGYMRFTDFHLGSVDTNVFDTVLNSLKDTKGIIIDIRELHGGNLNVISSISNRFALRDMTAGYQEYKNGPGENDFAPLLPVYAKPGGTIQYGGKVILLAGQMCFSAGEIFAYTMSLFDNVTIVGDTTFGGVEAPAIYSLPDGTRYSVPVAVYLDIEKQPLEWKGVAPDIYIDPAESANNTESDPVFERAFGLIN